MDSTALSTVDGNRVKGLRHDNEENVEDSSPTLYLTLARQHMSQGKTGEALSVLKNGLQVFPDSADLRGDLGKLQGTDGCVDEAIQNLEAAAKLSLERLRLFEILAGYYKMRGNNDLAVSAYKVFLAYEKLMRDVEISPRQTSQERDAVTWEEHQQTLKKIDEKSSALEQKKMILARMEKYMERITQRKK